RAGSQLDRDLARAVRLDLDKKSLAEVALRVVHKHGPRLVEPQLPDFEDRSIRRGLSAGLSADGVPGQRLAVRIDDAGPDRLAGIELQVGFEGSGSLGHRDLLQGVVLPLRERSPFDLLPGELWEHAHRHAGTSRPRIDRLGSGPQTIPPRVAIGRDGREYGSPRQADQPE